MVPRPMPRGTNDPPVMLSAGVRFFGGDDADRPRASRAPRVAGVGAECTQHGNDRSREGRLINSVVPEAITRSRENGTPVAPSKRATSDTVHGVNLACCLAMIGVLEEECDARPQNAPLGLCQDWPDCAARGRCAPPRGRSRRYLQARALRAHGSRARGGPLRRLFLRRHVGPPRHHKGSFDTYLRYGGQLSYLDPIML